MFLGLTTIFRPISVFGSVIPLLGIGLLVVASGAVVLLARFAAKKKAAVPVPAS